MFLSSFCMANTHEGRFPIFFFIFRSSLFVSVCLLLSLGGSALLFDLFHFVGVCEVEEAMGHAHVNNDQDEKPSFLHTTLLHSTLPGLFRHFNGFIWRSRSIMIAIVRVTPTAVSVRSCQWCWTMAWSSLRRAERSPLWVTVREAAV